MKRRLEYKTEANEALPFNLYGAPMEVEAVTHVYYREGGSRGRWTRFVLAGEQSAPAIEKAIRFHASSNPPSKVGRRDTFELTRVT